MEKSDHLDTLSAIWILASNNRNPLMLYESIRHRLRLNKEFDVKDLITLHGELFRLKAHQTDLDAWKVQMKRGEHLPTYIQNTADAAQRAMLIDRLSIDDCFRSQFRTNAGAAASDVEVITWGLEHIDRMRKTTMEERQQKAIRISSILIPIISLLISLSAIFIGYSMQLTTIKEEDKRKKIELEYKTRQDGYAGFMKSAIAAYTAGRRNKQQELINLLDDMETSYYTFEPLLKASSKSIIWNEFQQFSHFCTTLNSMKPDEPSFADSCTRYKAFFRNDLENSLYDNAADIQR